MWSCGAAALPELHRERLAELKTGDPPSDVADTAWFRRMERVEYKRRIVWKETQGF
jgi:hypothetical protein